MISALLIAAFLGAVQGITEFLPVSSTGHLVILQYLFNLDQATYGLSFDMFTNIGTLLAVLIYFRHDFRRLLSRLRLPSADKPLRGEERVPWWIIGVTALVAAVGFVMEEAIATTFRSLPLIAATLIGFGVVMLLAEYYGNQYLKKQPLTIGRAYGVGLAQILAFVPGVSRSGATISVGLLMGLSREDAARFSFLLYAPVVFGAISKRMVTAYHEFQAVPVTADIVLFYIVGLVAATVVGYFTIAFLLAYVRRASLAAFVYYRFALGAAILLYLAYV
jgi:undecaprenyl-diphosphatase